MAAVVRTDAQAIAADAPGSPRRALLGDWQRNFPLVAAPFAHIAATLGTSETAVLHEFGRLQREGAISRIGWLG